MTRTRLAIPNLPLFILAAAVVAMLAFGATRWVTDRAGADTLPPLAVKGDTAAAAPGALDPNALFQARVDTTVSINATINDEPMNGSGVVVDAKAGLIVTASHVIKDYELASEASSVVVRFHAGDEVLADVVAVDQLSDLAILKVDPSEVPGIVAAPMGNSDELLVGSEVMAIGAPFGYEFTMTLGNVSAEPRVVESRINGASFIAHAVQHDTSINTGNSGGPLFNARGQVVGINQQIATPSKASAGVAFAVSSNLVARAVKQYQQTGEREIRYADLGIVARNVTPQLARQGDLGVTKGAIVQEATGPATAAGVSLGRSITYLGEPVVLGDVIVEVAGRPVTSTVDLAGIQGILDPAAPVDVTVVRAGKRVELSITPTSRAL